MRKKKLQIQQLDAKLKHLLPASEISMPSIGWIKAIRSALGISLQQLGNKMSMTKQSVMEMEQRELEGTITIKSLKEVAKALDMELVYGFIPLDKSLEALIHRKSYQAAEKIVMRTSNTMKLEDQEVSNERIKKAIDERAREIKDELPKFLWD